MVDFNATNYTRRTAVPSTLVENEDLGVERTAVDKFNLLASGVTNNDRVRVGTIPAGARLLPDSYIDFGAFGASATVTVGTNASAALFAASTSVVSATRVTLSAAGDYVTQTAQDVWITITNKGAAANLTGTVYLKYLS